MAEFNDQLNSILSDPGAMAQIMQLAQSLSGGQEQSAPPPPSPPPQSSGGDLFGSLDPALLMKLLPLLQELGSGQDSHARHLLYALRPYLKQERQDKVERALQLARLFRVGKKFLAGWEG